MKRRERGWNNQLACYNPATNEWSYPEVRGEWPCPRAAHAAAKVGSSVFIFGGRHGEVRMNDFWKLDLKSMRWSQILFDKAKGPEGRSWHSLTAISTSELVLYGGLSTLKAPLCDSWIYCIPNNKWIRLRTTVRIPRLWHSTVYSTVDDEILIFGGGVDNIFNRNLRDVRSIFSPFSFFNLMIFSRHCRQFFNLMIFFSSLSTILIFQSHDFFSS